MGLLSSTSVSFNTTAICIPSFSTHVHRFIRLLSRYSFISILSSFPVPHTMFIERYLVAGDRITRAVWHDLVLKKVSTETELVKSYAFPRVPRSPCTRCATGLFGSLNTLRSTGAVSNRAANESKFNKAPTAKMTLVVYDGGKNTQPNLATDHRCRCSPARRLSLAKSTAVQALAPHSQTLCSD